MEQEEEAERLVSVHRWQPQVLLFQQKVANVALFSGR